MANPQRNASCRLTVPVWRELNRLCQLHGIARNHFLCEAIKDAITRYSGLPLDHPDLARLVPNRQIPQISEDLTRLERKMARMEAWIEQTAANAKQAGWQPGQSRNPVEEMSVVHRNVLGRHSGSRSNLLVDRAPKR